MAAFNKFSSFGYELGKKTHNLSTDILRISLCNSAPTATDTVYAVATLHPAPTNANGYNTLGGTTTVSSYSYSSVGTLTVWINDFVFTATAGGIGPFQYVILWNDTAAADQLIGWYNYGFSISLAVGETFTVDFSGTDGVFTLA